MLINGPKVKSPLFDSTVTFPIFKLQFQTTTATSHWITADKVAALGQLWKSDGSNRKTLREWPQATTVPDGTDESLSENKWKLAGIRDRDWAVGTFGKPHTSLRRWSEIRNGQHPQHRRGPLLKQCRLRGHSKQQLSRANQSIKSIRLMLKGLPRWRKVIRARTPFS